jgi:Rod binding domain-containing protein
MHVGDFNAAASSQLPVTLPQRAAFGDVKTQATDELRERFTQFVGEAFFGQMLKAMRATVGKPAYFHGGRAEEVFQGQLDQKLAEHLTEASAERFAEPMFERQFPHLTEKTGSSELSQLMQLRRI